MILSTIVGPTMTCNYDRISSEAVAHNPNIADLIKHHSAYRHRIQKPFSLFTQDEGCLGTAEGLIWLN